MQHLVDALNAALNEPSSFDRIPAAFQLVEQYLRTGDEKLLPPIGATPFLHLMRMQRLPDALPLPDKWSIEDRRLVHFMIVRSEALMHPIGQPSPGWNQSFEFLRYSIAITLQREEPGQDFLSYYLQEFAALKIAPAKYLPFLARYVSQLLYDVRMTSLGRFLAALPIATLVELMPALRLNSDERFFKIWLTTDPGKATALAEALLKAGQPDLMLDGGWLALLEQSPKEREALCASAFAELKPNGRKFKLGRRLAELFPKKYDQAAWDLAPLGLREAEINNAMGATDGPLQVASWMLAQRGAEAVPILGEYFANAHLDNWWGIECKISILEAAIKTLGPAGARPLTMVDLPDNVRRVGELRRAGISSLIGFHDPADDDAIETLLKVEVGRGDSDEVIPAIALGTSWNFLRFAPAIWKLLEHKSKPVRGAAIEALATGLGAAALEPALKLLAAKKSDTRIAAAGLLGKIGSPPAVAALEKALAAEEAEKVADAIRAALTTAAGSASASGATSKRAAPVEVSRKDLEAKIRKAAAKAKLPADWADPQKLPALHFKDGDALDADAVRYLLFRQARSKTIEADSEAQPLYNLIDHASSGDFAFAVLKTFLEAGAEASDRWALAIAGLLGDERVVPILSRQIQEWAESSRGKLAEYAVQALALQASDPALLAIDGLAIRFRTKFKNVGAAAAEAFNQAAQARGISTAELGDRVIPWLGFTPGQPRLLAWKDTKLEVTIGLELKLAYRDTVKNKRVTALPGSTPAEEKAEMKSLAALLKEAAKAQTLRLENLMVQQHRWPAARWAELFLQHPLLLPFAVRLVWGAFDEAGKLTATFRALEDRTLTTADDEATTAPQTGTVGIVHPLELPAEVRKAWLKHLADYEIVPPFPQLERAVIKPEPEQRQRKVFADFEQTELNAMTFRGRAEKRGWVRGSVCDGGIVPYYHKPFHAAGVDVFLALDSMFVTVDMYSSITLETFFFVRLNSVETGSYTYDEPRDDKDPRLITAEEVPAIAFSEALGDLRHIAGKAASDEEE